MKKWIYMIVFLIAGPSFARADGERIDQLRHGKLDNGLTYYIWHTSWKPGYADFYLVQNVGALMEEDDQNGLAHVLEHMAFNATENFPGGVQYFLKRQGITDFNAYTGQDETVYNINHVPTGSVPLVDSCLLVLRDWSGFLSLLPNEIEKERNVILEERRVTRDVGQRVREQSDKYIYNDSKYAEHNVIGSLDVLNQFSRKELYRYYKDFYRPDQQAVIIVGDVDAGRVEQEIKRLFNAIPKKENPKPRLVYAIPDNAEPLYSLATDPEIPSPMITLMKRIKVKSYSSGEELMRDNILRMLYNKLVAKRLTDYVDRESPSFTGTSVSYGKLIRGYDALNIVVKPIMGEDAKALREVLEELERIRRFGFTNDEFREEIRRYGWGLDQTEQMKGKLDNEVYVKICQNNFLSGKPLVSVDEDIRTSREILSAITTEDLKRWMDASDGEDKNWIYLLSGKDASYDYLTREEILSLSQEIRREEIRVQVTDSLQVVPLIDFDVKGGRIVKMKPIKALDAELWVLDNGCKVYYKYTDDHVNVNLLGESYGGKSVLKAEDLPSAEALGSLVLRSGLYHHSNLMMQEIMKGHKASANLRLGETNESVSGGSSVEDAEMMFQLIYLLFEKPSFNRVDFDKFVKLSKMEYANRHESVMDSVGRVVQDMRQVNSPRRWQVNEQFFDAMDYDRMVAIYKDRFKDASDFTFYLVGGIPVEQAKELVARYLGAIPSIYRKEHYQVHDFRKRESFTRDVEAVIPDERYIVNLEYNRDGKFSGKEALSLEILGSLLKERCNKVVREGEGGTYGVEVETSNSTFPAYKQFLGISFQSSLDKGPQMRALVHREVEGLTMNPIDDEEVSDMVLLMQQGYENYMKNKNNGFWMQALRAYVDEGKDITSPGYFEKNIEHLSGKVLQAYARKFFSGTDCFDIVLKSKK